MNSEAADDVTALVRTLVEDNATSEVAVSLMVERLRRMEDEARLAGADRQTLQRIMSARRVLGDRVEFGPPRAPFADR